jgi:hypothetical protein
MLAFGSIPFGGLVVAPLTAAGTSNPLIIVGDGELAGKDRASHLTAILADFEEVGGSVSASRPWFNTAFAAPKEVLVS